jgi:HK97 family phage prohead protease
MSEIVSRSFDFTVDRSEERDDGLSLEGYAAVFNSPAQINGERQGPFTEVIAPGAFAKTIAERSPVMQFDHGSHPLIGSMPLGVVQHIREDEHGLFVRARLSNNWLIQPVRDAIKDGAIKGMSFRFSVPEGKDSWDRKTNTRTIHEAKLYELGPVVFPAYQATSVGVRSAQLLNLLSDETVRQELATVLTFGHTISPQEAAPSTSDGNPDEPPPALDGTTRNQRLAAYRKRVLIWEGIK